MLQEQVLSHRGLMFESRQIRWRCLCSNVTETFPAQETDETGDTVGNIGTSSYHDRTDYSKGYDGFDHLRMWVQRRDAMPYRTLWQRDSHFDAWYSMVSDYNVRVLSHESDVLSALAGLASAIATTHRCTYLAGLWKEDLQTGLCWYVTETSSEGPDVPVVNTEVTPSWTWISRRGRNIRFCGWENNQNIVEYQGLVLADYPLRPGCQTVTEAGAVFSSIVSKELMATGRIRKIAVESIPVWYRDWPNSRYKAQWDLPSARWIWRVRDITTDEKLGHISFDSDPASLAMHHVFCLLCIAREKYGEWQLVCLALIPTDETLEEFERVGLIVLRTKDWFGELIHPHLGQSRARDTRFHRTIRIV